MTDLYSAYDYTAEERRLLIEHDYREELHAFFPREDTEDDDESVTWEVCGECGDTPEGLMHNNTWRSVEPLMEQAYPYTNDLPVDGGYK